MLFLAFLNNSLDKPPYPARAGKGLPKDGADASAGTSALANGLSHKGLEFQLFTMGIQ